MRAVSRIGLAMAAAGLALASAPLLAQSAPAPTSNTPATDSIGPRELSNFSLGGTPSKPAETPANTAPARTRAQPTTTAAEQPRPTSPAVRTAGRRAIERAPQVAATAPATTPAIGQGSPLGGPTPVAADPTATAPQPGFSGQTEPAPETVVPEQKLLLWPWMLLALVIGVGGAMLLWRRRSREAYADGPEAYAFAAPEPEPAPAPPKPKKPRAPKASKPEVKPAPTASEPAKPVGIVSSRLRPWVDLGFAPIGCLVNEEQVVIDFEVQLTNGGSAPAREILVEASMFNAGASQDQDIGGFFANPHGQGERIEFIAPLQQISIRTSLVAPRQNIQVFEVGGKQVFVPLVAFNVIYRGGSSGGQTSAAFMLGRETKGEKLGPLRADLGPKIFGNLGTRPLEVGVRS